MSKIINKYVKLSSLALISLITPMVTNTYIKTTHAITNDKLKHKVKDIKRKVKKVVVSNKPNYINNINKSNQLINQAIISNHFNAIQTRAINQLHINNLD